MKRKISKCIAALAAISLILLIMWIANSMMGNPITKAKARKDINEYLQSTYNGMNYKLQSVSYNFKFKEYNGHIICPTSLDSNFEITWANGKITYDSYEFNVVSRMNTIERIEKEVENMIFPLLSKNNSNANVPKLMKIHVRCEKEFYDSTEPKELALDSHYDKSMDLPLVLTLNYDSTSPTVDEYVKLLTDAYSIIKEQGYHFEHYSINNYDADSSPVTFSVDHISPNDIESGNLASLITAAKDSPQEDSFGKGPNDSDTERKIYAIYFEKN